MNMWLCKRDLSKECDGKYKDCTDCMLNKIRAEIETDLSHFCFDEWGNENPTWKEIKAIIDKYNLESEDKK